MVIFVFTPRRFMYGPDGGKVGNGYLYSVEPFKQRHPLLDATAGYCHPRLVYDVCVTFLPHSFS